MTPRLSGADRAVLVAGPLPPAGYLVSCYLIILWAPRMLSQALTWSPRRIE